MVLLNREPSREAERGVTLVETLVALLILSLVALSVLQIFSQGVQLNVTGANYTAITNVVKDKSEELLAMDFFHADLAPDVTHSESVVDPPLTVSWRVGQHNIIQGTDDPTTAFTANPLTSSAAGTGNFKVIAVTVASQSSVGFGGNRDVTVQAFKAMD